MTETVPPSTDDLVLAAEFPTPSRPEWQRLVARVLHGSGAPDDAVNTAEAELSTDLRDGVIVAPLYTAADSPPAAGYPGQAPFVRGAETGGQRAGWDVRQRHGHPDPTVAREHVLEDLEGGATSVWLEVGSGRTPVAAIADVLTEVYLDLVTVVLDAGVDAPQAAERFLQLAADRNVGNDQLRATLGIDPLSVLARTGSDPGMAAAITLAQRCIADYPHVQAIIVDALPFHNAGGSDVDELAGSMAAGVEYLRALHAAGIPIDAAAGQLEFRYAATADQFATIAKLRAARRMWSRVADSCGVDSAIGQRQHAVTSWPMMSRRDPWNNILRATLACMAAGVGGAQSITVLPFDAALGLPDALARRVARNIHALLVEESHVARVIDPAGGSWYVESLTDDLAQQAWGKFQEIERAGGIITALTSGQVAEGLTASRNATLDALAHGTVSITGVSEFPRLGEELLRRDAAGDATPVPTGCLPTIRWSEPYEALRDRADAYEKAVGSPPSVTLVPLGDRRGSSARADRVAALLSPAGITTAVSDPGEVLAAVACLCVADDTDHAEITNAITALTSGGVSYLIVAAGKTELDHPGIDDRIVSGMDVLAFQTRTLDSLEGAESLKGAESLEGNQ